MFCATVFSFIMTAPTQSPVPVALAQPSSLTPDLENRIDEVLAQFRPTLNFDGGDVKLTGFQDGVAEITMLGACIECPISVLTMTIGVKRILLKEVPEVTQVSAIFADGAPVPSLKDYMAKTNRPS